MDILAQNCCWQPAALATPPRLRRKGKNFQGVGSTTRISCSQSHHNTITGANYDEVVLQLARMATFNAVNSSKRKYIVGVAGAPGSGKSTLANLVCSQINNNCEAALPGNPRRCVTVPMDGFHYYKAELDSMTNPVEAHARRGAHWTFDALKFVDCIRTIRQTGKASVPSFDHGKGDPVPDDIQVLQEHTIVLVEGNYVLLTQQPWAQLRDLFDDTWFVDCPIDIAMQRVFKRQTDIGLSAEVSEGRIAGNDRPNAELVDATRQYARILVPSTIPFGAKH